MNIWLEELGNVGVEVEKANQNVHCVCAWC